MYLKLIWIMGEGQDFFVGLASSLHLRTDVDPLDPFRTTVHSETGMILPEPLPSDDPVEAAEVEELSPPLLTPGRCKFRHLGSPVAQHLDVDNLRCLRDHARRGILLGW